MNKFHNSNFRVKITSMTLVDNKRISIETSLQNILVVDDDFAMRRGLGLMLQGKGYGVSEASDGSEALQIAAKQNIDLAILDLFLPDVDGIELAQEIKQTNSDTKIILLTAFIESTLAKKAQEIFKEDFLEKLDIQEKLIFRIEQIFRNG